MQEIVFIILGAAIIVLLIALLVRRGKDPRGESALRTELVSQFSALSGMVADNMDRAARASTQSVDMLRVAVDEQLGQIRASVGEKLDTTLKTGLDSSFRRVDEQLRQVYGSMGEMRSLTAGIGDLKNILANVKTRGVWGEVQLGRLLEDFIPAGQYVRNAKIGQEGVVEYAISLPDDSVLPIDSKFPMDRYARVLRAMEGGGAQEIKSRQKELAEAVLLEGKKIADKYIRPPQTTDFAVMFLPSEGLYCEVIRLGLLEALQSRYRVMAAGPSTITALLTSLQVGFRNAAIKEHSTAILEMLLSVRGEFDSFAGALQKTMGSLNAAQNHLESVRKRTERIRGRLDGAGMPEG